MVTLVQPLVFASLLFSAGCTRPSGGLPDLGNEASCRGDFEPPTYCEWIGRLDALVIGEIAEIKWETTLDAAESNGGCDWVAPAMIVSLKGTKTVWSRVGIEGLGENLEIHVGPEVLPSWRPQPVYDTETDTFSWWPSSDNALIIGQLIGFALHADVARSRLTPGFEPLFRQLGEHVELSDTSKLCSDPPTSASDFAYASLDELGQAATACGVAERAAVETLRGGLSTAQCHPRAME